jgi:hypothetical protein
MLNTSYLIIASEARGRGRMKQRRHKSCCIHQDQESTPAVKTKKWWLSRRINLHRSQGWCRSGAPKIGMPTKRWSEVKKRRSLAIDYKRSTGGRQPVRQVKNKLPRGQPVEESSYREGNPKNFFSSFSSKLVLEFAMWLNNFRDIKIARSFYLNFILIINR